MTSADHAPRAQPGDPELSVIIASYQARELLAGCLESIDAHPPSVSYEVLVVDDASTDGTAEMVRTRFPEVTLLRNDVNVHYGRSNNRAIAEARGRYVLLLNNDTLILPGSLDAMLHYLEQHPEVGAVGSRLLNEDGSVQWSVKSLPNPMSALFGARSILTRLFPRNRFSREHLLHPEKDDAEPFAAGYVSSAAVMFPRSVIDRVGGLDERLSYHVDADYCKRVWDEGLEVHCLPSASIVHLNHRGGTLVSPRRRFWSVVEFHRGGLIYFRKHLMKSPWHPLTVLAVVGLGARFVVSLVLQVTSELWRSMRLRFERGAQRTG
jgi:hypothetical protein